MVRKIAIIGLPNSGKSQIFNNLTGEYSVVANYPHTTIEIKRARREIGDHVYEIIDTPGLYGLCLQSQEGPLVQDLLFAETPDIIIHCVDACRLKQSLALSADLMDLGIPMVVALNDIDESLKKGIWIDSSRLSHRLLVPVVESVAVNGHGTAELLEAVTKARNVMRGIRYGDAIEKAIASIESRLPDEVRSKRKASILLLMNDAHMFSYLERVCNGLGIEHFKEGVDQVKRQLRGSISRVVNNKRSQWVDEVAQDVARQQKRAPTDQARRIARWISHPLSGLPVLAVVVYTMYFLVVNVANVVAEWMTKVLWLPVERWISAILPAGFTHDLLIGDYGLLSLGIANALLTVLPILSVFYLLFNTLEDIGYIPNLSVMTSRIFGKLGLSGNALMPLVLGFGCKTMATLTTRTLPSPKERLITAYLIAFAIPCAAQTGINMSILGRMGLKAFLLAYSVLVLAGILSGLALNALVKGEKRREFIHELPAMRLPSIKGILIKTYYRLKWFLKEAVPVFIYASLILFFMDRLGILDKVRTLLGPIVQGLLGLPVAMVDTVILCMVRREAAVGPIVSLIKNGQMDYVQCIVAVIITTMFFPCFANIVTILKEFGARKTLMIVGAINVSALLIGGVLNWTLVALLRK